MNWRFEILDFRFRILVLALGSLLLTPAQAQDEDELNRTVTVERDFQPVIQAAGKVATHPEVIEQKLEPAPIEYSQYTADVNPGTSFNPLLSQPTRFEPGKKYNGYIRGGAGYANTLFDFGYHLDDGNKSILDVYAHHKAQWGVDALSRTKIGLNFTHPFSTCNLYFGINGGNIYYHKFGHWYDFAGSNAMPGNNFGMWEKNKTAYAMKSPLTAMDKTALWTAEAYVGIKANAKQEFQYRIQTGYKLFAKANAVSEHQLCTHADFNWHSDAHHVGANIYMQNNFLHLASPLGLQIADTLYNTRHNLRIEPYYGFEGKRFRIHLGVNLDLNIGRGKNTLSGTDNISFAPSPHIYMEAQVAKKWLTIYADAKGNHGLGSLQGYMEANRYRLIHPGIVSHHSASYTPVDAELGFHIRPYRDLLFEIHGGYAYYMDAMTLITNAAAGTTYALKNGTKIFMTIGDYAYTYSDYGRGMIGGQINYHLQDIVRINLSGDYFFWSAYNHEAIGYNFVSPCQEIADINAGTSTKVYDRPEWKLDLRIDGRIDRHWSLYSDNHFVGGRLALASDGEHYLRPIVELNLGAQYEMWVGGHKGERLRVRGERNGIKGKTKYRGDEQILSPEPQANLVLFAQLNNWLHCKNEYYYGYRSQGINFLLGATYRF